MEDLYRIYPELRDTFLFPEKDSPCLIDIKTGYCYISVFPKVSDLCNIRKWWIRTDKVKDPEQYKDALKALNKIIYKQKTINKMSELLCTTILASSFVFSTVLFCKFFDITNTSAKLFATELFLTLLIRVGLGFVIYLIFYHCVKGVDVKFAELMSEYISS